jgi:hypothetical protein
MSENASVAQSWIVTIGRETDRSTCLGMESPLFAPASIPLFADAKYSLLTGGNALRELLECLHLSRIDLRFNGKLAHIVKLAS